MAEEPEDTIDWGPLLDHFERLSLPLYAEARLARRHSIHYQTPPKRVGCGCVGCSFKPKGVEFHQTAGANHKPAPGLRLATDFCGEHRAEDRAEESGATLIVGMVIVGDHQADDDTGMNLGVLIPCGYCRRRWAASIKNKGRVREQTLLIMMNPDTHQIVKMNVGDLLRLCPPGPAPCA